MMQNKYFSIFVCFFLVVFAAGQVANATSIRERIKERRAAKKLNKIEDIPSYLNKISIMHQGVSRSYYVYVPENLKNTTGHSAMFIFHGGGGNALRIAEQNNMKHYAEKNGFIVLYPNSASESKRWNDGRPNDSRDYDDVGFIKAVGDDIVRRYGANKNRFFAAGISNGGMFSQRLACDIPDYFQGYGIVASSMSVDLKSICSSSSFSSMIFFHGTDDLFLPFDGGKSTLKIMEKRSEGSAGVLSQADTKRFWVEKNKCTTTSSKTSMPDIADDGTTVTVETFTGCHDNNVLKFYTIHGGGHNWPGGSTEKSIRLMGNISQDVDASAEIVQFFKQFGL